MTMRYDDGLFICKPGEKPWSSCLYRWKVSIVSVLLFLLLPLLTSYRQNYYLVMGEPTLLRNYRSTSTRTCDQKCNSTTYQIPYSQAAPTNCSQPDCPQTRDEFCHQLNNNISDETNYNICDLSVECRTNYDIRLQFCNWRSLKDTIILNVSSISADTYPITETSTCLQMTDKQSCISCIKDLIERDEILAERNRSMGSKLDRYDCNKSYSMWNCSYCRVGILMLIFSPPSSCNLCMTLCVYLLNRFLSMNVSVCETKDSCEVS